jgi:N-hydroxyarylamine O-acetyltransferase
LGVSEGECTGSEGEQFRISRGMHGDITLHRWIGKEWERLYQVEPLDVFSMDIDMANHFTSTWPQSPFIRMFMCVAYDGKTSWMIEGGELVQRDSRWEPIARFPIKGPLHLLSIFETHFRIQVSETLLQATWKQAIKNRQPPS